MEAAAAMARGPQTHGRMGADTYMPSPGGVGLPVTRVYSEGYARAQMSATNFDGNVTTQQTSAGAGTGPALLETMSGVRVEKAPPLKKQYQVGAKGGQTSYKLEEHCFHVKDVPADKLATKREVRRAARGDLLGRKPQPWDASVESPSKLCERRLRQIPDHDRPHMIPYNYRAEELPPKNPQHVPSPHRLQVRSTLRAAVPARDEEVVRLTQTQRVRAGVASRCKEMCVHPDLEAATPWDRSSQCQRDERMSHLERAEAARLANSAKWLKRLGGGSGRSGGGYRSPQQRGVAEREEQRRRKRLLQAGKAAIREAVRTPTGATRELGVHRSAELVQRDDHGADVAPQPPNPTARNRYAQEPSRRGHVWRHSGAWEERVNEEGDTVNVWSDTMSEVRDSPGDIRLPVNPDAWQYSSPFKPKTQK